MGCAAISKSLGILELPCHMDALPSRETVLPLAIGLAGSQCCTKLMHIGWASSSAIAASVICVKVLFATPRNHQDRPYCTGLMRPHWSCQITTRTSRRKQTCHGNQKLQRHHSRISFRRWLSARVFLEWAGNGMIT